ncbi:MAG TPA: molecular chaperone TorD family protein [Candidatus Methylomirabilis sp.]|nr:molecular chaperone TorD family protein [Candidatus Methylomirabilis sp.]
MTANREALFDQTLDEAEQARADVYALLGGLLAKPPDAALVGMLQRIQVADTGGDGTMAAAWATLKQSAGNARIEALAEEYQDLFVGIGRGELVPYGSWYMTGFLMEKPLAELRVDLRRFGLQRQDEAHEPEDHAAALCETMSLLAASGADVTYEQQREFFAKHVGPWMARFFGDMAVAPSARFYRAVALLGERFIEVERTHFSMLM